MVATWRDELEEIRAAGRWRTLRRWAGSGGIVEEGGRRVLNFSSNDYLNLANAPRLKAAVHRAVEDFGCSAAASRLMSGNFELHERLEGAVAALCGHEAALVYPSGYQANVGLIAGIAGRGDTIYSDALNHASLIDGARLSRAGIEVYRHRDVAHLAALLAAAPAGGRKIVVTDSVFSMDGDIAPLAEIEDVVRDAGALLVVDEAHALGIWGGGGGVCRALGVKPDVVTGTFGKSVGSGGAFAAGSAELRDLLINRSRGFIFSTGLTPMNAAAALEGVAIIAEDASLGPELLRRSALFIEALRAAGVVPLPSDSQIVPVMVGNNHRVVALAEALFARGIAVTGIRPPTVPEGTARLRFSITLAHEESELREAAAQVARILHN